MATKRASRESCKSVSMKLAPRATAFLHAAMVFSGAFPDAPRCAMTSIKLFSTPQATSAQHCYSHKVSLSENNPTLLAANVESMLAPDPGTEPCTHLACILNLTGARTIELLSGRPS